MNNEHHDVIVRYHKYEMLLPPVHLRQIPTKLKWIEITISIQTTKTRNYSLPPATATPLHLNEAFHFHGVPRNMVEKVGLYEIVHLLHITSALLIPLPQGVLNLRDGKRQRKCCIRGRF